MMYNHHIDKGMVKQAIHFLGVNPHLDNRTHFHNTPIEIVGEVKCLNPCEMHKESKMIGIDLGVSPLTGELFHDSQHQGCIPMFEM